MPTRQIDKAELRDIVHMALIRSANASGWP